MTKQANSSGPRRPSIGGTIAKIVFGVMFIALSFSEPQRSDPVTYVVTSLAIGFGLIAWGLLPWLRFRKEEKRLAAEKEEQARLRYEQRAEKDNAVKLCPACGATSRGKVCEYCGSKLP